MLGATNHSHRRAEILAFSGGAVRSAWRGYHLACLGRRVIFFGLSSILLIGCSQRDASSVRTDSKPAEAQQSASHPSPADSGVPFCRANCARATRSLFAGWLGFDPADGDRLFAATTSAELLAKVQAAASKQGKRVLAQPLSEFVAAEEKSPQEPAVLVSSSGHYYLFVGAIKAMKDPDYEIVHGNFEAGLYSRRRLQETEGVVQVWTLSPPATQGIPIHVGNGELTVSKLLHNFGEVRPDLKYEVTINMKNTGSHTILLKTPHTTCGCTKPSFKPTQKPKFAGLPDELLPGQAIDMVVGVNIKPVAAVYLPVTPALVEKDSAAERDFEVQLVAFQRKAMEVTPRSLDFGTITIGGDPVKRSVRIVEVPTDRFHLKAVKSDIAALSHRITEEQDEAGLTTYRVEFLLDPAKANAGTYHGEVTVVTDSDVQATKTIAVSWRKKGHVEVQPPVLSFGAVRPSDRKQQKAQLLIPGGDKATFDVKSADATVRASVMADEKGASYLVVQPEFGKPGAWKSKVTVQAHGSGWNDSLEVELVAYVLEKA